MGNLEDHYEKGEFEANAAATSELVNTMAKHGHWHSLDTTKQHALVSIQRKVSRILCGNPESPAPWIAIQEYAKLAEDRCVDPNAHRQGVIPFRPAIAAQIEGDDLPDPDPNAGAL